MMVKYRDINTGEIRKARYFRRDDITGHTWLVDADGTHFVCTPWQMV